MTPLLDYTKAGPRLREIPPLRVAIAWQISTYTVDLLLKSQYSPTHYFQDVESGPVHLGIPEASLGKFIQVGRGGGGGGGGV